MNPEDAFRQEAVLNEQLRQTERNLEAVIWNLVEFYSSLSQPLEASRHMDRLLSMTDDPERKAGYYLAMGQLKEQQNDFDTAAFYYSQALAMEPTSTRTWYFINNNLGYCLNQLGRHTDAEPHCRAAIRIDPNRYNAYKNLGVALQGLGRYFDAACHYVNAVEAAPGEPRAFRHLVEMVRQHPEIRRELRDIEKQLLRYGKRLPREGDSEV